MIIFHCIPQCLKENWESLHKSNFEIVFSLDITKGILYKNLLHHIFMRKTNINVDVMYFM